MTGDILTNGNDRLDQPEPQMTEKTIDLDHHRGMAAQKATDLRRLLADVGANERACASGRTNWKRTWSRLRR